MPPEDLESIFGETGDSISADESFTGEDVDFSNFEDEKRDWYKEVQGKYTKKRQAEAEELRGIRERLGGFEALQNWEEYQIWADQMKKKYPDEKKMPTADKDLVKRIEELEGKTGTIDIIQHEKTLEQLENFVQQKGLPSVDKYYKKMEEILAEKCQDSPDGKAGLDAVELYMLAIFPDLVKLTQKGSPLHFETSSGRGNTPQGNQILSDMSRAAKTGW